MNFLTSLAIILLSSLLLGSIFVKIKLPPLIGMLIVGIVLGPHLLNLIAPSILAISPDLRQLALIIILTRAGLSLNLSDLRKVGRPAILMCFIPATFEICGYMLFGTLLLKLPLLDAAILGTVLAAVSPAVVVPRMLRLQNEGFGVNKGIPQMITAGASCDDVFVIVIFTALLAMATGGSFNFHIIWRIPTSIILGVGVGCLFGFLFALFFKRVHMRDTIKIIILLSFSFLFVALEELIGDYVPFSGLLAVISLGVMLNFKAPVRAQRLSVKYSKMWIFAEILLFVLVGAEVNFDYVGSSGLMIIAVMFLSLIFRVFGVFACLIRTNLNAKERIFCAIAYLPKATVQAAIGAIPFTIGLASGQIILTCAVLAILITAPLGALATDMSYKKLLTKSSIDNDITNK
ncbi:MAG: cation:proton antiporter [Clostridia bacterium]